MKLLGGLAEQKEDLVKQLRALKEASVTGRSEMLGEMKSLIRLLRAAKAGTERSTLRRRIKARLQMMIDSIWVYIQPFSARSRVVHVQIFFKGERSHYLRLKVGQPPKKVGAVTVLDLDGVDLSNF